MHATLTDDRGAALIMVLWFAAALGVIAVDLTVTTKDTSLRAANTEAGIRARAALQAAQSVAIELLRRRSFDRSGQVEWQFDGASIVVRVEPESGKIDLNGASAELIEGLARTIVEDEDEALDLAHAILDWRDENDLRLSHGAEQREYRTSGLNYAPADGPFRHVRELDAVLGLTEEQYASLAPALTIATGSSQPDELLASEFVLEALDIARGLVIERGVEQDQAQVPTRDEVTAETQPEDLSALTQDDVDEAASSVPALGFFEDPAGLYTLDLQARMGGGYTERSRSLAWIEPPVEATDFLILQHESGLLPRRPGDDTE